MRLSPRVRAPILVWCCGLLLVSAGTSFADEAGAARRSATVRHVIERTATPHGVVCVVGGDDEALILELARASEFLIHVLDPRPEVVAKIRKAIDEAGLYGTRVVVEECGLDALPHADGTVDVVLGILPKGAARGKPTHEQVMRVLRPGGASIRLVPVTGATGAIKQPALATTPKPPAKGVDDWTHWEHGPDNNPVSTDAVIQAPYMTQWLGDPLYIAMPAITTAAGGRIFIAMGHIAHHVREESCLNTLLARNGHNGTPLWQRKLPDGYLAHRSAFVATDDAFYMIDTDGSGCLVLDPQTGEEKDRIDLPQREGEWKWIAIQDGRLYVLTGMTKDPAETTIVRSQLGHWSWGELSKGYYQRRVPWGFGKMIVALDLDTKKVVWRHREATDIDSRSVVMGGGRVYFYAPDARMGCLDAKTGKLAWTNDDAKTRDLIEQAGRGLKSTPGFKTTCYCLYTPKALFYQAQTRMNVVAVSLEDGHLLWHRTKTTNNPNMLYVDGHLFVGIGPNGNTLELDPLTGETLADLGFAKRSCARLTATPDSLFCRGAPEGLTRFDRKTRKVLFNGAVRPACNDGVIGANGLLYIGPWACDCNLSLMGRLALCSAGTFDFERKATDSDRLQTAQGGDRVTSTDVTDADWATYRADVDHTGSTPVNVPRGAVRLWRSRQSVRLPTAPTAAGGMVFIGDGDGRVTAIDAATGKTKWTFLTAGPIMQPPTLWQGRAYVGSADGYVYALTAATGRMLWRFRAAPVERRIMVYGSLCSTWPVNSGVLVDHGVAYAAAGIIDYDGTYLYALDAMTGKLTWQNVTSGHLSKELRKGVSAQGNLAICGDQLRMPGGNVVPLAAYRVSDGQYTGAQPGDGSPKANRGEEVGVFKKHCVITGGRLRYSARDNVVNPGAFVATSAKHGQASMPICWGKIPPAWNDANIVLVTGRSTTPMCCRAEAFEEFLSKQDGKAQPRPVWTANALRNMDVVSLAIAPNAVLAVCEVPQPRRIASRWQVFALRTKDGSVMWKHPVSNPALPGGLLVDRNGRIIVVLEDGRIECLAGPRPT